MTFGEPDKHLGPADLEPLETLGKRLLFWRIVGSVYFFVWAGLLLAATGTALFAFVVYDHTIRDRPAGPEVEVTIPKGFNGQEIGDLLVEEGLVEHPAFFRLALRLDESDALLRNGIYDIPQGISAAQVVALLKEGPKRHLLADQYRLTIPEGLSIAQTARYFDNEEAWFAATSNPSLIERVGIDVHTLEGFLMPDTYFFDDEPTPEEAAERMVAHFEEEYARLLREIPGAADYDKYAIVTVAALVEEEARVDEERPIIAAVIYNRIDKGMPLQMDSTLQFALNKYGQRMLDADKEVDSPYNTYRNAGLPPGPICSPGAESIRAAMQPSADDYLYFVSNADGKTHTFSRTLREHNRAVARYNREISVQRRLERERQNQ